MTLTVKVLRIIELESAEIVGGGIERKDELASSSGAAPFGSCQPGYIRLTFWRFGLLSDCPHFCSLLFLLDHWSGPKTVRSRGPIGRDAPGDFRLDTTYGAGE